MPDRRAHFLRTSVAFHRNPLDPAHATRYEGRAYDVLSRL